MLVLEPQGKWDGIESDDGLLSISVCWIGIEDISNQFMLRHEIGHTLDWGHAVHHFERK